MPIVPLMPLFHSLNREHFNGVLAKGSISIVGIKWSDGRLKKTAGFYRRRLAPQAFQKPEIVLSRPVLEPLPMSALQSTLCHEMIHAWIDLVLGIQEGHGVQFHKKMNTINSAQDLFKVSVRHNFPTKQTPPRWLAICPSCNARFPYKRRVTGAACRHCCNILHGGSWHYSCLLEYVQVHIDV